MGTNIQGRVRVSSALATDPVEGESESSKDIEKAKRPQAVGWERNRQGKLASRLADLGPMMDPAR